MIKYRSFVLPFAIIIGLIFHAFFAKINFIVPYIVFTILLLNFFAIDVRKLRFTWLDVWLMLFQIVVSLGAYLLIKSLHISDIIAEGVLVGVLCPVAASVVVVACMLGANRETVTSYTIWGNLMVAVVAPVYFSFIGMHQDMPFWTSFCMIISKISPIIVLPFFIALLMQFTFPKVKDTLARYKSWSFYLWACALVLVLGKTFDFVFIHGKGNEMIIVALGVLSMVFCAINFIIGKWIGRKCGDSLAGGQLLGQKNTAFGIWMATIYLSPLASIFMAFYSIWQNVFNSWQLFRHDRQSSISNS